ncbi:Phosphoesterase family domain containing protein [Amanita muscaria]
MRSITIATALSAFLALPSVRAQSGSTTLPILSAFPSATAAALNNAPAAGAPTGKVFKYFVQIWLENQDYSTIFSLPQFQAVAQRGITLTNYNAITHPSEPNYVASVAGSNLGITNDDYYDVPANESTIFDLIEQKGLKWKAYNEDIPAPGYTGFLAHNGSYVRKHNPAIIFDSIGLNQTRSANVVSAAQFVIDIQNNNIPAYSFYTPNMTNDGHDTNGTFAGNWLDSFLQTTIANASFVQEALILITFDENETYTIRNQVWSCLIGGVIPQSLWNTTDNTFYTHYSALSTVELNWGLGNLGKGDTNTTLSNVFAFAAPALGYTNVNVSNPPFLNNSITGILTNNSWNETHTSSSASSAATGTTGNGSIGAARISAAAILSAFVAGVLPYLF